ncbi:MAG: NfeD family protein [Phycisphaerae bacterium]|nr:NfeD family protein [Phycisphaerae bacterium]
MDGQLWWIWMVLAAVLIVAEMFTAGFFLLWFGIGAGVAGVMALIGLPFVWQLIGFIVVSGLLFAFSRQFAEEVTAKQPPGIGADRFVGQMGVVIEAVDNIRNTGRIRVGQDEWRADSATGEGLPVGTVVKVVAMSGTHAVVRQVEGEAAEQQA